MQPAPRREGVRARGAGPPGGSWAALTLLKFIQAAGAAEGAHGGRLPAAASLHPRGGRPPTSRALHDSGPQGLVRTHGQLGGPPGGGGGRLWVPTPRYHNAPLAPARHPVHEPEPVNPVGATGARAALRPPPAPPPRAWPLLSRNKLQGTLQAPHLNVIFSCVHLSEGAAFLQQRLSAALFQREGCL